MYLETITICVNYGAGQLESVSCYSCGSNQFDFYDRENGYTLKKCRGCGLLLLNPRPPLQRISESVRTGSHSGRQTLNTVGKYSSEIEKRHIRVLKTLYPSFTTGFTWLDIGCGHGEFLQALNRFSRQNGSLFGYEPNEIKRASIESMGFLSVSGTPDPKFDFISLLNVFSHLPNPIESLKTWRRWLKKDGELLLETGDTADLLPREQQKPYFLPDHLSFANESILKKILRQSGFEILSIHKFRHVGLPWYRLAKRDMWIRARRVDG